MPAMAFPCRLESGLGRFRRMSEEEEIAQSVRMILSTSCGERTLRSRFGSHLSQYAFAPVDTTLKNQIRVEILAALQAWEPRIRNIQVEFEPEQNDGALIAQVSYQLRSTGQAAQTAVPVQTG